MRLLVCGGRDFKDYESLSMALHAVAAMRGPITCVIHGDYRGADKLAGSWARNNKIEEKPMPAEWTKYGTKAGPIRNAQMIREGRPDRVVAFPGGDGTQDMIDQARAAKLPVWVVNMKTRQIETLATAE